MAPIDRMSGWTERWVLALLAALILASCAKRESSPLQPKALESGTTVPYLPLLGRDPPFELDLLSDCPFTKWSIPFSDDLAVGCEVLWLECPQKSDSLPPLALVINNFSCCKGVLCLVAADGRIVVTENALGLVQEIHFAQIAPISSDQLLVLCNPGRGTGAAIGEFTLFEVTPNAMRRLLSGPRYSYRDVHDGPVVELGIPLRSMDSSHILLPVVSILEPSDRVRPGLAECGFEVAVREFKWDETARLYKETTVLSARPLLPPEALDWLTTYRASSTTNPSAFQEKNDDTLLK